MMPRIAEGDANKVWVVPSEITKALEGLGSAVHEVAGIPRHTGGPRVRVDMGASEPASVGSGDATLSKAHEDVEEAIAAAEASSRARPDDPEGAPATG
jgi:hypothetical protein